MKHPPKRNLISGAFRWRRKNRRRLTLPQRIVLAGCLLAATVGFIAMCTAGTKSAQAEAIPQTPVRCEIKPLSLPENGTGTGSDVKHMEESSSHAMSTPMTRWEVKQAPVSKTRKKAVTVVQKPVTEPVITPVKAEAEVVAEKESPIPSFENTSGEPESPKSVAVAGAKSQEAPVWKTIVSVMFKLALVLGLAYASMLGLKWFMQNKPRHLDKGSSLKVLETVSLWANRSLHVVQCGGRQMILASTPNQVNLISESEGQVQPQPAFEGVLQSSIAKQSEMDTSAMKVGQALRNGAAFLYKKASEYKTSHGGGTNGKNA